MTRVAELPDSAAETKRLRACLRDLVALSTTPVWWIGLPPAAIAESLRDLLMSMLRADVAYVRFRDADSGACLVAAAGADPARVEAALERTAGSGELPTLPGEGGAAIRLASLPVGLEASGAGWRWASSGPAFRTRSSRSSCRSRPARWPSPSSTPCSCSGTSGPSG